DVRAGRGRFWDFNLNYVSEILPFRAADRNWVATLNYQEVYDFKQQFTADIFGASRETGSDVETRSYQDTVVTGYRDSRVDLTVTEQLTTELSSVLQQVHADDLAARLDFDQEGIISAVSPALAVDLTKTLAVGVALNVYQDGEAVGRGIRSRIRADYEGTTDSRGQITTTRRTTGTYTYEGVAHFEPSGDLPFAFDVPFSGTGEIEPFSDASQSSSRTRYYAEGQYEEVNEFRHLSGVNATFGMLWAVNTHVNLGFAFDLPWTAEATQEKTVNSRLTTYDESRARVLDVTEVRQAETRDVEFDFPAYYAAGLAVKWNHRLYSMLDVSRTDWSRFAFQAEGGEKINPLDGAPYDAGAVDDCWAVRAGTEYVLVFRHTECPLRAGVGWEERPAIGEPDETWSVSGGAGVSLGKGPLKCLLDLSYTYSWAQDALESLVPAQSGMSSDVDRHQVYISMICHF
ncbi:MAG: hypothetical protein KA248_15255, partial [Kiritimatiellae bacterium]|nr:hypothetical protein [Kiritimatiellia bacterium]